MVLDKRKHCKQCQHNCILAEQGIQETKMKNNQQASTNLNLYDRYKRENVQKPKFRKQKNSKNTQRAMFSRKFFQGTGTEVDQNWFTLKKG
jgi:hypothetical protein